MDLTLLTPSPPLSPPQVSVPQGAAGSSGEGLVEELSSGEHGRSAPAARSGAQPRAEEGTIIDRLYSREKNFLTESD